MKYLVYTFAFLILIGCRQSKNTNADPVSDANISINNIHPERDMKEKNQTQKTKPKSLSGFDKATIYELTDTILADFNGDGFLDKAIYKKENETAGIIIIHGKTNDQVKIGFGKEFAHMTEFDWVDYWGLVKDKETSETTFNEDGDILNSKVVELKNPSIALGKDEVGGELITFINGKYVWIHQTC